MGIFTSRITDKQEKLQKRFIALSDEDVKVLVDKWINDHYNWESNGCLNSVKEEHFIIRTNRASYKAPWDKRYKLISISGGINYYDSLNFGINDFGRCWLIYQAEHCQEEILYNKSIDEFLEEYLDD